MLEEYRQIAKAYGDLHTQKNDLLKLYIAVIGVGASVITILVEFPENGDKSFGIAILGKLLENDYQTCLPIFTPIIGFLTILLSFIGLMVFMSIIGIRIEMILYVRTINALRGYFVEQDKINQEPPVKKLLIKDFLVLPDYDEKEPLFRPSFFSSFFWITIMIIVINTALFISGFFLLSISRNDTIIYTFFWVVIHLIFRYKITNDMENRYITKRKKPKKRELRGTTLSN
jgi:hypothetical protein